MLSSLNIQCGKYYAPNWLDCLIVCPFMGKVRQALFQKAWEINAVMKRNDSNCVGILSDQGEPATVSNLSEYTISGIWSEVCFKSFRL